MRISDWSSDVCSSDLCNFLGLAQTPDRLARNEISANLLLGSTLLTRLRRDSAGQRWGLYRAGAYRVAAHALRNEIGGNRFGHANNCRLGRSIHDTVRDSLDAGCGRRHIEDGITHMLEHAGPDRKSTSMNT